MTEGQAALRIAVDGASGAGKTTTARALGERLGQVVVSPEEAADGRTALFDWMDYAGGRHRGQPIQTQVIAVPGHRYELRRAIIELADVVLFVADSTPGGIYESAEAFRDLQVIRAGLHPAPSLVVQANKRDAPDAHDVDELRALLEVDDDVAVVETVASTGDGVRQAFVFAVRSGLARLDSIDAAREDLSPVQLEGRLRSIAGEPAAEIDESALLDGSERASMPDLVDRSDPEPERELVDAPTPDPTETIEIENRPEDVANLEPLPGVVDAPPIDRSVAPADTEPHAGGSDPADAFAHLPPPPANAASTPTVDSGTGRTSWWRRRGAPDSEPVR